MFLIMLYEEMITLTAKNVASGMDNKIEGVFLNSFKADKRDFNNYSNEALKEIHDYLAKKVSDDDIQYLKDYQAQLSAHLQTF